MDLYHCKIGPFSIYVYTSNINRGLSNKSVYNILGFDLDPNKILDTIILNLPKVTLDLILIPGLHLKAAFKSWP